MVYDQPRGPELCFRVVRVRPRDTDIFLADMNVDQALAVHHIKRLLMDGKASALDVDSSGQTVITVRKVESLRILFSCYVEQKALYQMNLGAIDLLVRAGSDYYMKIKMACKQFIECRSHMFTDYALFLLTQWHGCLS